MAPVNIKVTAFIRGSAFPGGPYPVEDTTLTWSEVFKKIGLRLNPGEKYWVRNGSWRVKAVPEAKVEDFIKQFKIPKQTYSVHVAKSSTKFLTQHKEKTKEANDKQRTEEPQDIGTPVRPLLFTRVGMARHHADLGEGSSSTPKRPRFGRRNYCEDSPRIPNDEPPQVVHDFTGDVDDTASVLSQDSLDAQDNGNIKASVARKFMLNINGGDLIAIKKEFLKMKENEKKTMKVARYIPTTLIFLGVLFANEPNVD